jgi:hypothetical protein
MVTSKHTDSASPDKISSRAFLSNRSFQKRNEKLISVSAKQRRNHVHLDILDIIHDTVHARCNYARLQSRLDTYHCHGERCERCDGFDHVHPELIIIL